MALSREMLDDVEAGRTARYVDVTSGGGPPAQEVLGRFAQAVPEPEHADVPGDQPERVATPPRSESNIPASSTPNTPREVPQVSPLARLSDDEPLIRLAQELVEPRVRPREEEFETTRSIRPRIPPSSATTSEPERETFVDTLRGTERTGAKNHRRRESVLTLEYRMAHRRDQRRRCRESPPEIAAGRQPRKGSHCSRKVGLLALSIILLS